EECRPDRASPPRAHRRRRPGPRRPGRRPGRRMRSKTMQIAELIAPFSADQTRDFGTAPMSFRHRLAETGLFEDEALAELLDRYPAELYDINLFDFDAHGQARMRTRLREIGLASRMDCASLTTL